VDQFGVGPLQRSTRKENTMLLRKIFIQLLILTAISCTIDSARKEMPDIGSGCGIDSENLHALKMQISKRTGSAQLKIDSSATPLCVRYRDLTVYFVKVFDLEDGYIISQQYIGFCIDDSTKQRSTELTVFSDEMIDLTDSTWNEAIRLVQEPRLSLNDVDNDGWPELIIKERLHNGTVYHAVAKRIYQIDPASLSLKHEFSFEEISWLPADDAYVKRILQGKKVLVYSTKFLQEKGQLIGSYLPNLDQGGKPVELVSKDDQTNEILYTSSPDGEIPAPHSMKLK
jgi:hypothetical protein